MTVAGLGFSLPAFAGRSARATHFASRAGVPAPHIPAMVPEAGLWEVEEQSRFVHVAEAVGGEHGDGHQGAVVADVGKKAGGN